MPGLLLLLRWCFRCIARDAGGNFSANTITATTFSGAMSGNGAALTNINAINILAGLLVLRMSQARTRALLSWNINCWYMER